MAAAVFPVASRAKKANAVRVMQRANDLVSLSGFNDLQERGMQVDETRTHLRNLHAATAPAPAPTPRRMLSKDGPPVSTGSISSLSR